MTLYNAAVAELITALIIWALWVGFSRPAKPRGKLLSAGVFLLIWGMVAGLHLFWLDRPSHPVTIALPASHPSAADVAADAEIVAAIHAHKAQIQAIIVRVVNGASVDQRTHDQFWSLIPHSNPEVLKAGLAGFTDGLSEQREFWESIRLSAQAHQVVKTQAYLDMPPRPDPAATARAETMLHDAATGQRYTLPDGSATFMLDEAFAARNVSDLDGSQARVPLSFQPSIYCGTG
jgi:hypothetical protein